MTPSTGQPDANRGQKVPVLTTQWNSDYFRKLLQNLNSEFLYRKDKPFLQLQNKVPVPTPWKYRMTPLKIKWIMQSYKWLPSKNEVFDLYQSPHYWHSFQSSGFSTIEDIENVYILSWICFNQKGCFPFFPLHIFLSSQELFSRCPWITRRETYSTGPTCQSSWQL